MAAFRPLIPITLPGGYVSAPLRWKTSLEAPIPACELEGYHPGDNSAGKT